MIRVFELVQWFSFNFGSGEIVLDKEINSCNIAYKYSLANESNLLT
jgi:hypothetical protein